MPKPKRPPGRPKPPEKNTTGKPRPPAPDVRARQDDEYTEDDFLTALDKSTRKDEGGS